MNRPDSKSVTPDTTQGPNILALVRHWLQNRLGWLLLGLTVVAGGSWISWPSLVAAGIAPLLLTALPCIAMCALGLCMKGVSKSCGGKSNSPAGDVDSPTDAVQPNLGQTTGERSMKTATIRAAKPREFPCAPARCPPTSTDIDVDKDEQATMKRDVVWMTGIATAAAILGVGMYIMLNGGKFSTSTRGTTPSNVDVKAGLPSNAAGARAFAFAAPNANADDISEVTFVDGDGQRMSLAHFRGRDVLLNVWATWCGPCREEMPTLDRLQSRLGSSEFEVVALSIDQDGIGVIRDFYQELGLQSLRMYVDSSGLAAINLNVLGLPSTLLINREGRELGRYVGPVEWDSEPVIEAIQTIRGKN